MTASQQIDHYIKQAADWRGEMLQHLREIIHEADPEIVEEWKWKGTPVWSDNGVILFANALKDKVKLGFLNGAHLPDPDKLFNAELEGNKRRAIELRDGDTINEKALKVLIRSAAAYNTSKKA